MFTYMRKFFTTAFSLIFLLGMMVTVLASCSTNEADDFEDDNTEYEEAYPTVSSEEKCSFPTAIIATDIPDYLQSQIAERFSNVSTTIDASTKVVVASTAELTSFDKELITAFNNGVTLLFVATDKSALIGWVDSHGLLFADDRNNLNDIHMVYGFNNRDRFILIDDVTDPSSEEELAHLPIKFDSLVRFLNSYASEEPLIPPVTDNDGESKEVSIKDNFGKQVIYNVFDVNLINKELAHVASSKKDLLTKSSTIELELDVYPLYSKKSDSNKSDYGDYYLLDGHILAHNGDMYNGKWTEKHGGVISHLCGFYMSKLDLYASINAGGKQVRFPAGKLPTPETTIKQTTYTSGFSWTIGGGVTGKVDVGTTGVSGGGQLTINGSCSWNNSMSRTLSDLDITRLTNSKCDIHWEYTFNNLPRTANGKKCLDVPNVARGDFQNYLTWIWWVKDIDKDDVSDFTATFKVVPEYKSYRWFSSAADFKTKAWTDGVKDDDKEFTVTLCRPNRNPSNPKKN